MRGDWLFAGDELGDLIRNGGKVSRRAVRCNVGGQACESCSELSGAAAKGIFERQVGSGPGA